jgi:WD40 repeat protein
MVRVWRIGKSCAVMEASMKEHKGPVNSIALQEGGGAECVSASSDGSAIIWDLATFKRRASLFANTFFQGAAYHPDGSQLVTVGSDRKVGLAGGGWVWGLGLRRRAAGPDPAAAPPAR